MLHSRSLSPSPSVSYPLPGFFPLILPPAFSFHFSLCPSVFAYIPVGEKDSHLVFPVSWLVRSWQWTSFQPSPFFWTIHTTCAVLTNLLNMVHPACSAAARKSTYTSGTSCYFPFCKRREKRGETARLTAPGWQLSGTARFSGSGVRAGKRTVSVGWV